MNLYNQKEFRHSLLEKKTITEESFTIENENDIENAILAITKAKDKEAAKKHIIKRAKTLKKENLIPTSWLNEAKTDMSYRLSDDDMHDIDYEFSHIDQNLEPSEIVDIISDKLSINWFEVSSYLKRNGLKDKVNESTDGLKKIVLQIYPNGSESKSYLEIDTDRKIVNVYFDPKEPHLYHESLEVGNTLDPDFESDEEVTEK